VVFILPPMKPLILTLAFGVGVCCLAQTEKAKEPELPKTFTTTKGLVVQKILGRTEQGLRVMHENGISVVPVAELPPEVAESFGIEATPNPDAITLPDPLVVKDKTYLKPALLFVEPDGIRIQHEGGSGKIGYELLPGSVQLSLGGFDHEQAMSFRAAEKERLRLFEAERHLQKMKAIDDENKIAAGSSVADGDPPAVVSSTDADDNAPANEPLAQLRENPEMVSRNILVALEARSSGGKKVDTPFNNVNGSSLRNDVSVRNMFCTITSKSAEAQRVRLQCLLVTRTLAESKLQADIVADTKVDLGPNASKLVTTTATASSTDAKNVILGVSSADTIYIAFGVSFRAGEKYRGWSWRAIDGQGRVCAVRSSLPSYDRLAWSTPLEP
jgi:hypothetical protein